MSDQMKPIRETYRFNSELVSLALDDLSPEDVAVARLLAPLAGPHGVPPAGPPSAGAPSPLNPWEKSC